MLGSGNLGLIYLMEEQRRLTLEEIDERHPELVPALRESPSRWLAARALERARPRRARGGAARDTSPTGRIEGDDPLASFSPTAGQHLLRTDGFAHVADIMVGSFYDPELDEGCAFEELISFHGGLGGPQTQPFILHPVALELPDEPIIGAEHVHTVLSSLAAAAPAGLAGGNRLNPQNRPHGRTYLCATRVKEEMWLRKELGQAGWRSPACS